MTKLDTEPQIGDVQVDKDKSEWIVIGVTPTGVSRIRRYSLAHHVHSDGSPEIAESLKPKD